MKNASQNNAETTRRMTVMDKNKQKEYVCDRAAELLREKGETPLDLLVEAISPELKGGFFLDNRRLAQILRTDRKGRFKHKTCKIRRDPHNPSTGYRYQSVYSLQILGD